MPTRLGDNSVADGQSMCVILTPIIVSNDARISSVQVAVKKSIGTSLFSLANSFWFRWLNSLLKLLPKLVNKCNSSTTTNRMRDLSSFTRCGYFAVMLWGDEKMITQVVSSAFLIRERMVFNSSRFLTSSRWTGTMVVVAVLWRVFFISLLTWSLPSERRGEM